MRVAMQEEEEAGTAASVEGDMLVSAVVRISVEAVAPTAAAAAMAGGTIHPEFRRGATAITADMGRGTLQRETRQEARSMVLAQLRGLEPLPSSSLVRRIIQVATTSRQINRELALLGNPTSNPDIIREQIAISGSSVPLRLQEEQRDRATLGQSRI